MLYVQSYHTKSRMSMYRWANLCRFVSGFWPTSLGVGSERGNLPLHFTDDVCAKFLHIEEFDWFVEVEMSTIVDDFLRYSRTVAVLDAVDEDRVLRDSLDHDISRGVHCYPGTLHNHNRETKRSQSLLYRFMYKGRS